MEIKAYFNRNFLSSNTYIKICLEYEDDNGNLRGMFASIFNPASKKTQIQKYVYAQSNVRNYKANIAGRNPVLYVGFADYANNYQNFNDDIKLAFNCCIMEIPRAMVAYFNVDKSLTNAEKTFIRSEVSLLCNNYYDLHNGISVNAPAMPEVAKNDDWKVIDLNSLDNETIIGITTLLQKDNSADGVVYNGNRYRVKLENGEYILQGKVVNGNAFVTVETIAENVRKMIKMAKMKNADGLTEFINGNFYTIEDMVGMNGKQFIVLSNEIGEKRKINASRVEIIDVYAEPPINEPETAL